MQQLAELGVEPFDLVVSNLYPFRQTVASGASPDECVEQIDIGGPSMVRAAAKNHPSVAIVTSPSSYDEVLAAVAAGGFTLEQRQRLAAEAFAHTAAYDVAVASWMGSVLSPPEDDSCFPAFAGATFTKVADLRYGENPHQPAALYADGSRGGSAGAEQLFGKEMSYNNYVDTDAARRAAWDFDQPAVAIIKHANPCGIAVGADIAEAHRLAHECDPVVGVRRGHRDQPAGVRGDGRAGRRGLHRGDRRAGLRGRRGRGPAGPEEPAHPGLRWPGRGVGLRVPDGLGRRAPAAVDHVDAPGDDVATWTLAAGPAADDETLADLAFAWKACRAVKSNAILLANDGASVGIGMGQVNRVDSCRLAVSRAGDRAKGSVAASDAFFPFEDGPQILLDAGVRAIVQPGGSLRDQLTIEACEKAGVPLYFTGTRHFAH